MPGLRSMRKDVGKNAQGNPVTSRFERAGREVIAGPGGGGLVFRPARGMGDGTRVRKLQGPFMAA